MNEELRGTIKTLQDIPLVKSGSYEFIGDSNITYADIYILLEFIRNQEQKNKKYKEVIDNLKDKLMKYFEVGRDSYFYVLTRDKSAFDYGTMSFDDFKEFSEEQVDDIIDFLNEVEDK